MSSHINIVHDSVRTNGRDTVAVRKTGFLKPEALNASAPPLEPKYELWTEQRSAKSRARREERENRAKPPPVAEVPDFDLETHLQEAQKDKLKPKWKFW